MTSGDPYPPISDYGLISDMHSCALVSREGSVDWCCFPRFDSAAVFSRLLDWRKGGYFKVAPRGVRSVSRRYLPGTNVLETRFTSSSGEISVTDFLPVLAGEEDVGQAQRPGERHALIRIVRGISGSVDVAVEFAEAAPEPEVDTLYQNVYSEINPDGRLFFDGRGK